MERVIASQQAITLYEVNDKTVSQANSSRIFIWTLRQKTWMVFRRIKKAH